MKVSEATEIIDPINYTTISNPNIVYLRAWGYPGGRLDPGGNINRGETVRMYTLVEDLESDVGDLTVDISYKLSNGSNWTTTSATYNAGKGEWYVDWVIPGDATTGLYDVMVEVSDPDLGASVLIETGEFEVTNADPTVLWTRVWGIPGGRLDPLGTIARGGTVRLYSRVADVETDPSLLTVTISYGQSSVWTSPGTATYNAAKDQWYVDWSIPLDADTGLYDVKVEVSDPDLGASVLIETSEFEVTNVAPTVLWTRVWGTPDGRLDPAGTIERGGTVRLYSRIADLETDPSLLTVTISYGQSDVWTSPGTATYNAAKDQWYVDWSIPLDADTGLYDVKVEVSDPDGGTAVLIETDEFEIINLAPTVLWTRVWGTPDGRLDPGGAIVQGGLVRLYSWISDFETDASLLTVTISYGQSDVWTSPGTATYNAAKDQWYVDWSIPGGADLGSYDVKVEVSDPDGETDTLVETGEFEVTNAPIVQWIRVWGTPGDRLDPGGTVPIGGIVRLYSRVYDVETVASSLIVAINYRPPGGGWTSPGIATYNAAKDQWYVDWVIPGDADPGLYDVKVGVTDEDGGSNSLTNTEEFTINANPVVTWIHVWGYPGGLLDPGGSIEQRDTVRLYTKVNDIETDNPLLTVTFRYRPDGGSWSSPVAGIYDVVNNYWYYYWTIPYDAELGLYDVEVYVEDLDLGSAIYSESGEFTVEQSTDIFLNVEDITFSIEGGSGRNLTKIGINEFSFELEYDAGSDSLYYWFKFQILRNAYEQEVTFHVKTNTTTFFDYSHLKPVYSYNGEDWYQIDERSYDEENYTLTFSQAFNNDSVTVAVAFPYSYSNLENYLNQINDLDFIDSQVLGTSTDGHNIYLVNVTDPSVPQNEKKEVLIVGGQHSGETVGMWVVQGALEKLIFDEELRQKYVFYLIPLANPDGSILGHTRYDSDGLDLNREWDDGISMEPEVRCIYDFMVAHNNTLDLVIDSHTQSGAPYSQIQINTPEYDQLRRALAQNISQYTDYDWIRETRNRYVAWGTLLAESWDDFRLLSILLEHTQCDPKYTLNDYKDEGAGIILGIDSFFDP